MKENNIVVNVENTDPHHWNPMYMTGYGRNPLEEVFEALADQDGWGGKAYGNIAKDWSWDGNDFIVNIYDNIYDHAGNHLTAEDVKFCYDLSIPAGTVSSSRFDEYCYSVEATSPTQVVFHWRPERMDTYNGWFDLLSGQYLFTRAAWEASLDEMRTTPVGTGPYMLKEYVPEDHCTLVRNDNYWQKDESKIGPQHIANCKEINYKFVTEPAEIVKMLKDGSIDFSSAVPAEELDYFRNSEEFCVHDYYLSGAVMMFVNYIKGCPFNDFNLRAALFHAVSGDELVEVIGGEKMARKVFCFGAPGAELYNPEWEKEDNFYTHTDMEKAKEYMSKSSYDGREITIWTLIGQYAPMYEKIAQYIGGICDQLGIRYRVEKAEPRRLKEIVLQHDGCWDILIRNVGSDGKMIQFLRSESNIDMYPINDDDSQCTDPVMRHKLHKVYSNKGGTQENYNDLQAYINEQCTVRGLIQVRENLVLRKNLIKDADIKTMRMWILPGSFTFVE